MVFNETNKMKVDQYPSMKLEQRKYTNMEMEKRVLQGTVYTSKT